MSDLDRVRTLLGEPGSPETDPAAWATLERGLGVSCRATSGTSSTRTALARSTPRSASRIRLGEWALGREISEMIEMQEVDLADCESGYQVGTASGRLLCLDAA